MRYINTTPHTISVMLDNQILEIPTSGHVTRAQFERYQDGEIDGIPIWAHVAAPQHIIGWPPVAAYDAAETVIITSTLVAQLVNAYRGVRVVAPDTGVTAMRDERGQIVAVRAFSCWPAAESI
jgi:hypothetical protein